MSVGAAGSIMSAAASSLNEANILSQQQQQHGNPIEAFLNCLLNVVEREEGVKKIDEEEKEVDGAEMDET